MTVLDASLVVDALATAGPRSDAALERLAQITLPHAPAVFPAEVTSAVRRLVLAGELRADLAAAALDRLRRMRVHLHPFDPFSERVWELHTNATVYDAWYLALAERLGASVLTTDAKLATIPGVRCRVEVVGAVRS